MQVQQRDTEIGVLLGMLRTHGKGVPQDRGQPLSAVLLDEQASMIAPVSAGCPLDDTIELRSAVNGTTPIIWRCVCNSSEGLLRSQNYICHLDKQLQR